MTKRTCPACGAELYSGAANSLWICPKCGCEVLNEEEEYTTIPLKDYRTLLKIACDYKDIIDYLRARCQENCAGREGYRGKNRHVPGCPVYELGLEEE